MGRRKMGIALMRIKQLQRQLWRANSEELLLMRIFGDASMQWRVNQELDRRAQPWLFEPVKVPCGVK